MKLECRTELNTDFSKHCKNDFVTMQLPALLHQQLVKNKMCDKTYYSEQCGANKPAYQVFVCLPDLIPRSLSAACLD